MSGDKTIVSGAVSSNAATSPEFEATQDGWLNIAKALFAFAPNYLSSMAARTRAVRSEAAEFFTENGIKAQFDPYEYIDLEVCFCNAIFRLDDENFFEVQELGGGFKNYLEYVERKDFDERYKSPKFRACGANLKEFREDLDLIRRGSPFAQVARLSNQLATRLMRMYEQGFEEAVISGAAIIYARARSPLSPFKRVHPDQWRHFRVIDQEAGTAEGPTGELLFSVHVLPQEVSPQRAELAALLNGGAGNSSRAAAIKQCRAWLVNVIQASPDSRTHSNEELWEQALSRWSQRLSRRGFEEAYRAARESVDAPAWGKTGPRKRSRN